MSGFPVLGTVGLQASGKTTLTSKLEDLGARRIRMGDVVWEEVEDREWKIDEKNVAKVAEELREEEGMGAVAKRCVPIIEERGREGRAVVVDGIRGFAEVEVFREEFGDDFFLISIESSDDVRYDRIRVRNREDDTGDFDSFKAKDSRELGWGLEGAINSADYKICNEGSLEDLMEKTSRIFEEIMDKYAN